MKIRDIDNFFTKLSKNYDGHADVVIVGGAAAALMGGVRPTLDIDFEVRLEKSLNGWEIFGKAIRKTEEETGIKAQFAEDITHWSEITLLDYKDRKKLYKTFGNISVWILDPVYWAIGKISRSWDHDILDIIAVFKKEQPDPERTARIWLEALRESPRSSALFSTKKQIVYFFEKHAEKIWGDKFNKEAILKILNN